MHRALLDTDTLSAVIRGRNDIVNGRAADYVSHCGVFSFSAMTRFEVTRGFRAVGASTRLAAFSALCKRSEVLAITDEVLDCAAAVYATLKQRGALIGDADLIIASTALVHGLALVTCNTGHFARVDGLPLDSWTTP